MKSIVISSFVSLAAALAFDGPRPTRALHADDDAAGWSPRPTKAPGPLELARRNVYGAQTLMLAPDNTCGFISGASESSIYCGDTETCGFGTVSGYVGDLYCGSGTANSNYRPFKSWTTCIDSNADISSCRANAACSSNSLTLQCSTTLTGSSVVGLWCETRSFVGLGVTYVRGCATTSRGQNYLTAYTTQSGGTARPLVAASAVSTRSSTSTSTPVTSPGPQTTTPAPTPTPTPVPGSSGPPIGAIVGGVIGGIAAILLVGALIFFCLRSKKRKANAAAATGAVAPAPQPYENAPQYQSMQQAPPQQDYNGNFYGQPEKTAAATYAQQSPQPPYQQAQSPSTQFQPSPYQQSASPQWSSPQNAYVAPQPQYGQRGVVDNATELPSPGGPPVGQSNVNHHSNIHEM